MSKRDPLSEIDGQSAMLATVIAVLLSSAIINTALLLYLVMRPAP
jgi:hypothetical protein